MKYSYTKIRKEHASNLSDLSSHRGLDHEVLSFSEDSKYSDFVTFRFTNPRSKKAFELLCQEQGIPLESDRIVNLMLDDVLSGEGPSEVLEKISKKYQITYGMQNSFKRRAKYFCQDCGLNVGTYPGAYPRQCPNCGGNWKNTGSEGV